MLFLTVFYSLQFSEEIMLKRKPPLLIREYCPTKIGIIAGEISLQKQILILKQF